MSTLASVMLGPGDEEAVRAASVDEDEQALRSAAKNLFGSFADADLERAYCSERVRPLLITAMSWFGPVGLVVTVVLVGARAVGLGLPAHEALARGTIFTAFPVVVALVVVTLLAFWSRWRPHAISLPALETCITCAFAILVIQGQLVTALDYLVERSRGHDVQKPLSDGKADAMRYAAVLSFLAIFVPVRHASFFLVSALGLACSLLADGILGGVGVQSAGLYVVLIAFLGGGRGRMLRVDRDQWYFHRSVRSVLDQKQEEERARAAQAVQLAQVSASKEARSKLIRVVMHDLRSPLLAVSNTIAALHEAILHPEQLNFAAADSQCRTLETCATLMEGIVSDLCVRRPLPTGHRHASPGGLTHPILALHRTRLDLERIDSGRLVLKYAPMYVGSLVAEASRTFEAMARDRGVTLRELQIPSGALSTQRFLGDRRRLLQCLNNGVSNALKFTPAGGTVTISVREGVPHSTPGWLWVHVAVEDTGIGLLPEELARLQSGELFTQVGVGQMQGNGGTGIGLSIVREMLKQHGDSQLVLTSKGRDQGATFEMRLALEGAKLVAQDPCPQAVPGRPPRGVRLAPPAPSTPRCLHVENDEERRKSMQQLFARSLAVRLDQAESGGEALNLVRGAEARGEGYAIVLVGNQLPGMSGSEAARQLRSGGFKAVIVGITGYSLDFADRDAIQASGFTLCLDENMDGSKVVVALVEALEKRGALTEAEARAIAGVKEPDAAVDAEITLPGAVVPTEVRGSSGSSRGSSGSSQANVDIARSVAPG